MTRRCEICSGDNRRVNPSSTARRSFWLVTSLDCFGRARSTAAALSSLRPQAEALRGAGPVRYQGLTLRIVTRPAVVALKFLAATSPHRDRLDKMQDVTDMGHIAKQAWSDEDDAEARRLVERTQPGAGRDLGQLIDDLRHD